MIRSHDNQEHTTLLAAPQRTILCKAQLKAQSGAARDTDSSVRWRRTFKGIMSKSTRKLREMR